MITKLLSLPLFFAVTFTGNKQQNSMAAADHSGTLKITFINTVKGEPIQLNTGNYTNPFAEVYSISKFKYYISDVTLSSSGINFRQQESYHLIDENNTASLSFSFSLTTNTYQSISFLLGVDSIKNVSGAQTGDLDPLNDMFWTWNSGYIMAKMEGKSLQSKVVNNKVEFHIGGFSGTHNVLKKLQFNFSANQILQIKKDGLSEIIIQADFDTWWQNPNDIRIAETPICSVPGALAKKIADNYSNMFTIKNVINH